MKTSNSYTTIAYLFLAPALILMGVLTFWPVGYNTYLAFQDYSIADGSSTWNNFANFKYIAHEELFWNALKNSALYLLIVPVIQLAALIVAKMVNNKLPGMTLFRALFYIPVITSISIAGVVWANVYKYDGVLTWLLQSLGLLHDQVNWLGEPSIALYMLMIFTFWKGIGYYMVLYLAGLQAIPSEVEEAAILDGANAFQRFWKITVPMVKPTILLCTLLSTIAAIKVYLEVIVLTKGQADTYTALFYVYDQAFRNYNFGRAAAAGVVVTLICVVLAAIQFRLFGDDKK
ncbi:putative chitobiose transport system permease protein [Silvimonas terrae]|uniref:Putative chitobiose transport system permease protein n=1 Tax=Silvimonas terrae TaxID=300266 RepID=A0A840RFK3_9NEIS|nr:sugar ABC transporter permease [Silvimonas terrae]MBB5191021.1 putative chitobiose transport system permease protein [Silvimonas terrae]